MSLIHIKHQLRQLPYSEMMALSRELSAILAEKQGEIADGYGASLPDALARLAEGGTDAPKLSELEKQERALLAKMFSRQRSILVSRHGNSAFGVEIDSLGIGTQFNPDLRAALNQALDTALVIQTFKG